MNFYKLTFITVIFVALNLSCKKEKTWEAHQGKTFDHSWFYPGKQDMLTTEVTWKNSTRKLYIFYPKHFSKKGQVLLLHGWNLPPLQWCKETSIDEELRSLGFMIIIPDMGKSIYATSTYPQTLPTLKNQPLLSWLKDTVLAYLQDSLHVFLQGENNFVVGLSTGARGAFALTLAKPDLFNAVCLLSGDYDQTLNPDDNIMTYFYGDYKEFPSRWENEDNLIRTFLRKLEKTRQCFLPPIYISHGMDDPVVSVLQSDTLTSILLKAGCQVQYRFPPHEKHDYVFWQKETPYIVNFITSHTW